jgi:hypothetical protein
MASVSHRHVREMGESLVRTRLEQLGWDVTPANERGLSFYVIKGDRELGVQVKAIRHGNWQFTADRLMDISISADGLQTILGRTTPPQPDLIHILVKLDQDEYFVLTQRELYDVVCSSYETWLQARGGRRPHKPESMHCSARPIDLAAYQDNWALIGRAMGGK